MLARRLSFSRRRDKSSGGAHKDKPRTPSPTSTDQDSSEYDSLNMAAPLYPLKRCVLKKHSSGTLWAKRWLEVDDKLGCLLYYKSFADQVRPRLASRFEPQTPTPVSVSGAHAFFHSPFAPSHVSGTSLDPQERRTPSRVYALDELKCVQTVGRATIEMKFVPKSWNHGGAEGQECERLCVDCGSPSVRSEWLHGLNSRIALQTDAPPGGFIVRRLRLGPITGHIGLSCQNWSSSIGCEICETCTEDLAARAGVCPGDVLIAVNGTTVLSHTHGVRLLEGLRHPYGTRAELFVRQPRDRPFHHPPSRRSPSNDDEDSENGGSETEASEYEASSGDKNAIGARHAKTLANGAPPLANSSAPDNVAGHQAQPGIRRPLKSRLDATHSRGPATPMHGTSGNSSATDNNNATIESNATNTNATPGPTPGPSTSEFSHVTDGELARVRGSSAESHARLTPTTSDFPVEGRCGLRGAWGEATSPLPSLPPPSAARLPTPPTAWSTADHAADERAEHEQGRQPWRGQAQAAGGKQPSPPLIAEPPPRTHCASSSSYAGDGDDDAFSGDEFWTLDY